MSTNNELKVILVNDQEKLNCFKRRAYFYYNVGYNLDRYYAAYLKGTLDSLLQQEGFTNDEDRAVLVNYTKEKGKVLARKRTKRLKR